MDPRIAIEQRRTQQQELRRIVEREVSPYIQAKRGPESVVEEAFVRAIYQPDRRLG